MRLDKFLKVSRIFKRRTIAKEVSKNGRVLINDRVAKPGTELKAGDILEISYGQKTIKVKVMKLADHMKKEDADSMYELIEE
ncbi:RNA-binding S4 domain-containing protein [Hujiaoplasma nucleasis]|uniref:RQC P-site tRNA stabilizing factor n=1 Tax=Hujiaoplasma nucleasis TaxID=2725268 RepID=A0A7L6N5Y4_9MOLU|nr:RNA-binding S4 domain-containing protein [Hujiaoplasma nucleasis]QLY40405.1 RNA-binding S4 domain-containing protein [Hujiaoplasma nucleasis]